MALDCENCKFGNTALGIGCESCMAGKRKRFKKGRCQTKDWQKEIKRSGFGTIKVSYGAWKEN